MKLSSELVERLRAGESGAFEDLVGLAVTEALKALPGVVKTLTAEAFVLQGKANDFYKNHPELNDHRGLVQKILEREEAVNPGKPLDELLERVLPKVRERIAQKSRLSGQPVAKPPVIDLDRRLSDA